MIRLRSMVVGAVVLASSSATAQISPNGDEFQVNSFTPGWQGEASVATGTFGNFVVTWNSLPGMSGGASIQAQRFDAYGEPLGREFQVNSTFTNWTRLLPRVGFDTAGNFVILWEDTGSGEVEIRARSYSPNGTPTAPEFVVSSQPGGLPGGYLGWYIGPPALGADAAGNFVAAWASAGSVGSDDSGYSIQARRFTAEGTPLGEQFQVNSYTTSHQDYASIAVSPSGQFVIAWDSWGSYGPDTGLSIQAQIFDPSGAPVGSEFQVNDYTPGYQLAPTVAFGSSDSFVISWMSRGSGGTDSNGFSIQARRFDASGSPLGDQFQVNTYTPGTQRNPAVAASPDGDFVVTWSSPGSTGTDSSSYSIQAQRYSRVGGPFGPEFQVNTYTTDSQGSPAIVLDADGNFIISWTSVGSFGTDIDGSSVQAQRFDALFRDGFEGGGAERWSLVVP